MVPATVPGPSLAENVIKAVIVEAVLFIPVGVVFVCVVEFVNDVIEGRRRWRRGANRVDCAETPRERMDGRTSSRTNRVYCVYGIRPNRSAVGNVADYVRLVNVIYPNGRYVGYDYSAGLNSIMSRPWAIFDDADHDGPLDAGETTLAAYTYLGVSTIVTEDYQQADMMLDYTDGSGGHHGLRPLRPRGGPGVGEYSKNAGVLDEYTYTYDRAGNRTERDNALDSALDETYHYDDLARLTAWDVNGVQQKSSSSIARATISTAEVLTRPTSRRPSPAAA